MSLSIGIVGLPNVGKSTLFNALTNQNVLAADYPFATIEPNTGIVPVPDLRLQHLSQLYHNAPIKPATVTFVDIAGLVKGASTGEGLGNQFLGHIRSCDAIIHIVKAFTSSDEAENGVKNSIEIINTELALADLQTVNNYLPRLTKEAKAEPKLKPKLALLESVKESLESSSTIQPETIPKEDYVWLVHQLQLLTSKPVIYLFNVNDATLTDKSQLQELSKLSSPVPPIFVSAKLEDELKGLDELDRKELLASYGQTVSGLEQLISASYELLGLQSFLTAGDKEVRAWTIQRGSTAPQAAGVIHGDFERGFIAAEIVNYSDLISIGSVTAAKAKGLVRTEGKNYIMRSDDVVEFRFNVSK